MVQMKFNILNMYFKCFGSKYISLLLNYSNMYFVYE